MSTSPVPSDFEERRVLAATLAAGYASGKADIAVEAVFDAYRTILGLFDDKEQQEKDARKGRY